MAQRRPPRGPKARVACTTGSQPPGHSLARLRWPDAPQSYAALHVISLKSRSTLSNIAP